MAITYDPHHPAYLPALRWLAPRVAVLEPHTTGSVSIDDRAVPTSEGWVEANVILTCETGDLPSATVTASRDPLPSLTGDRVALVPLRLRLHVEPTNYGQDRVSIEWEMPPNNYSLQPSRTVREASDVIQISVASARRLYLEQGDPPCSIDMR